MGEFASRSQPLASRNRLSYSPPGSVAMEVPGPYINLIDESLMESEPSPPSRPRTFSSESIYALLSTSYSVLVVAFFKSLIDSLTPAQPAPITAPSPSRLRDVDPHDFAPSSGFPGESTPINTSLINPSENYRNGHKSSDPFQAKTSDRKHDLYSSIFELDSSDDDDLDIRDQYGTTLTISNHSKYKRNTELQPAPLVQDDTTAAELLDTEFPTLDEYHKVVHNFYQPVKPVPPPKYSLTNAMLAAIPSYGFSQFLKKERDKVQALISQERKASQSKITPLTSSQLSLVEGKWKARNTNERIVSDFSIDITVKDIQTLNDSCWLNDNVIDFYLNLVAARSDNIFCWTTHFFTTLKSKGYQGVARWAKRKKVNLLEKSLVIVPINIMGTHWAVAVIDNEAKSMSYYDSLSSRGNLQALRLLGEYMAKESERLSVPQIEYTLYANSKTPQQQNGFDCGVFTCTVAKFISEKLPLSFSQNDMRLIRRRMAYEIITNNLLQSGSQGPHL